jgi:hypothetical protein
LQSGAFLGEVLPCHKGVHPLDHLQGHTHSKIGVLDTLWEELLESILALAVDEGDAEGSTISRLLHVGMEERGAV